MLQTKLITTILKLAKLRVPVSAVWFLEENMRITGTPNLEAYLYKLDQDSLAKAVKEDMKNFAESDNDEHILVELIPETVQAKQIFKKLLPVSRDMDRLPFPLSMMNRREKVHWLTNEIHREQKEVSGRTSTKVKYGDPNLMPSFWLNEEWDWTLLTRNLSNVHNENYTGPGELSDFITRLVENCIKMKGEDPELFVKKNIKEKYLTQKMKNRGINTCTLENKMEFNEMEDTFATSIKCENIGEYKVVVAVDDIKTEILDVTNIENDDVDEKIAWDDEVPSLVQNIGVGISRPSVIKSVGAR